ncbi:MAG: hypothetical protein BroJett003_07100 [Planctomycetota bacterium]|nr:MAG: hypothetical protein BroJett003_07100 [Planctomycetota bacterium]
MRLILEMDGPVVDVEPAVWAAYTAAAGEAGVPRLDRAEFWRRFRFGEPAGRWVPGAAASKVPEFVRRFEARCESDECLELCAAQAETTTALIGLKRRAELVLVTIGSNKAARQRVLDREKLSEFFTRMLGLPGQPHLRAAPLRELHLMEGKTLICAASPALVQAAAGTGIPAVGIGQGIATAKRLMQAGASATFLTLAALEEDFDQGCPVLSAAHLVPGRPRVASPFGPLRARSEEAGE